MTVVVFDTNELQKDWQCKGLLFELIRIRAFYPPMEFCVPAIVLEELVANHERAVAAAVTQFDGATRKLTRLGLHVIAGEVKEIDYRAYLLERFDEVLGISALDWPIVSHSELVRRAVSRTPPFDSKGGGYRDALVWTDAVKLAATGRDVALVTQDRAFGEAGVLRDELAQEAGLLCGSVRLISDFGTWLLGKLPWKESGIESAVAQGRDQEFGEWLMQTDYEFEPPIANLAFRREPYWLTVEEVDRDSVAERVNAKVGPNGETLVEYDLGVSVYFEAEFPEGVIIEDSWELLRNPIPGRVHVRGELRMIARLGVLFDTDGWSLDELEWRRADGDPGAVHGVGPGPGQLPLFGGMQA